MSTLDAKTVSCASHALKSAPAGKLCKTLKTFLLKVFSSSQWQRAQRILAVQELGARCASQVADYLFRMLDDLDPSVLVQYVLFRCLPSHVQVAFASSSAADIEQLTEETDRILDFSRQVEHGVSSASVMDALSGGESDNVRGADVLK